jgi:hypothetical protein
MPLTRREFIRTAAAAGALLVAAPNELGQALAGGPRAVGATRRSRLFPRDGRFVVHSDLHNHTLLSDGAGRAEEAFGQMRAHGLDVAALTDHAIMAKNGGEVTCAHGACTAFMGINNDSWELLGELADKAQADGSFTALRGFEWSTGTLGHINVWFTEQWTDPATVGGLFTPQGAAEIGQLLPLPPAFKDTVGPALEPLPSVQHLDGFYEWLRSPADRAVYGGGAGGLAGFNHPGLYGDFEGFKPDAKAIEQMVSVEAFSYGAEDYLFYGADDGDKSPLGTCLDQGWRTGMLGVSDEHGKVFGQVSQPRAGMWVRSLTRAGVREALAARRFFATLVPGLRLDATANHVRMGSVLRHRAGRVDIAVDIDAGRSWTGKRLVVQVLSSGSPLPRIVAQREIRVPSASQPLPRIAVRHDVADGKWLLVRICDPKRAADKRAPAAYRPAGGAIAYASPFFLRP